MPPPKRPWALAQGYQGDKGGLMGHGFRISHPSCKPFSHNGFGFEILKPSWNPIGCCWHQRPSLLLSRLSLVTVLTQFSASEGHSELVSSSIRAVFEAANSLRAVLHIYNHLILVWASVASQVILKIMFSYSCHLIEIISSSNLSQDRTY